MSNKHKNIITKRIHNRLNDSADRGKSASNFASRRRYGDPETEEGSERSRGRIRITIVGESGAEFDTGAGAKRKGNTQPRSFALS